MLTDTDRLIQIHRQMQHAIAGIGGMVGILETHTEMLRLITDNQNQLTAWLKEPPSSELPDLLRQLVESVGRQSEMLLTLSSAVRDLPEKVVRAISDGDISRGI
jgi:hypothetical protein